MIIELLKYIYNNIFIKFFKYWLIVFAFCVLYLIISYFNSNVRINKIEQVFLKSNYAGNGVAISNKYILANKKIIDDNCFGIITKHPTHMYVIDNKFSHEVVVWAKDNINDIYLLKLAKYNDNLESYALLQIDEPAYTINKRLLAPFTINRAGSFDFKKVRVVGIKNNNFFITNRNILREKKFYGTPIFNNNYVLQGIIKNESAVYPQKTSRDDILNLIGLQTIYSVNNLQTIKKFLDNNNIKYSMGSENISIENQPNNPMNSVVNIICIKRY